MKILLQRVLEEQVDWDNPAPEAIQKVWLQWRSELPCLLCKGMPRCYFPKNVQIVSFQVHGFCDASEDAYAGVVYLRMVDSTGAVHISLVMAKTKVFPIKRLSIPRLELCGAQVLAKLLRHVRGIFQVPLPEVYAYVGNRVSEIVYQVSPDR